LSLKPGFEPADQIAEADLSGGYVHNQIIGP
jgi:hypothetical protein